MDVAADSPAREVDLGSEKPFRVGAASVDPSSREAQYPGGSQRIQPQNLKVLILLARHRGQVVTRERLVECCWGGRFVGDDVINRAISTLRQFAQAAGGFRIETVPRAGYRLVESSKLRLERWQLGALALALAACLLVGWLVLRDRDAAAPQSPPRIGLLPFTMASNDPATRQLASNARDSIADALSATQFQLRLLDSASAAPGAVDFVLSGDVTGTHDTAVITIRMEELRHHMLVFSQRFQAPRADSGGLAERIGPQVTGTIGWTISHLMLDLAHPADPSVTALMLRPDHVNGIAPQSDFADAQQIASRAPDSPLAQVELAMAAAAALEDLPVDQRAQALAAGRAAAQRARVLAPQFGDTHFSWCMLHSSVQLLECEKQLRTAMRVDPNSSWADWALATRYHDAGLNNDAVAFASHSLAHDPFTPGKIALMLRVLDSTGQTQEADQLYDRARRWWPQMGDFYGARVSGMIDWGDYAGIERLDRTIPKTERPSWYQELGPIAAAVRAKSAARVMAQCPVPGDDSLKSLFCITALAEVGKLEAAFAIAELRYPRRVGRDSAEEDRIFLAKPFVNGTEYVTGRSGAALRRDPRYLALAQRVGLLAYWRSGHLPDFCKGPAREPICSRI